MLPPLSMLLVLTLLMAVGDAGASNFSCASLAGEKKTWQHSDRAAGRALVTGIVLNPAHGRKQAVDARLFGDEDDYGNATALPTRFDARDAWPACPSIARVADQGCCGSCWALSAAMAMTDRQCILAGEHVDYSLEQLLSCSRGSACLGGDPADAFDHWTSRGAVSESCSPFAPPPSCEGLRPARPCRRDCQAAHRGTYRADLRYGDRYLLLPPKRPAIMQAEMLHGGPIVAILETYEDLRCYEGGVYEMVAGEFSGLHAVRLLGWGSEAGVPYWLAANSWGTAWGERGLFKIRRDANECNIEALRLVTGYPLGAHGGGPLGGPATPERTSATERHPTPTPPATPHPTPTPPATPHPAPSTTAVTSR